jgi:hypothetical protein
MASVSDLDIIRAISAENAHAILIYLCDDQRVRSKAASLAEQMGPKSKKRKATSPLAVCVQCDQVFDEDDNEEKDCWYHSGKSTDIRNIDICLSYLTRRTLAN